MFGMKGLGSHIASSCPIVNISSFSSVHVVRPIKDLFRPHDFIRIVIFNSCLLFVFRFVEVRELFWVYNVTHPADIFFNQSCLYCANLFSTDLQ
jgi:hypothetical protein